MLQYLMLDLFHDDAHADRPEWRPQVYASTPLAIACSEGSACTRWKKAWQLKPHCWQTPISRSKSCRRAELWVAAAA